MSRRSLLIILAALGALGALTPVVIGWQLARPVPVRIGVPPPELRAEAISFHSASGSVIHGWFSRAPLGRGAILLLSPIRANRLAMVPRARFLLEAGYSTLVIDLQGTGESRGDMIAFGWRERFDVLAAVQFLGQRLPGAPVGIIGTSLGGAAALFATPPLDVRAIVLEAVYPSIAVAVENRLRMRVGPAGSILAPLLLVQLGPRLGVSHSQLRPVDHIAQVRCPVLIIGGMNDLHSTEADTRLLYETAREPKQLWLIPGATHVDYFRAVGDEYREKILAFLGSVVEKRTG